MRPFEPMWPKKPEDAHRELSKKLDELKRQIKELAENIRCTHEPELVSLVLTSFPPKDGSYIRCKRCGEKIKPRGWEIA